MRTRRRAAAMRRATWAESSGPRPGQNHGRTLVPAPSAIGIVSKPPVPSTWPRSQSWPKTRA